jgi:hypothetical protein
MKSLYDLNDIKDVIAENCVLFLRRLFTMKPIKYAENRKEYFRNYYFKKVKTDPVKIEKRRERARLAKRSLKKS